MVPTATQTRFKYRRMWSVLFFVMLTLSVLIVWKSARTAQTPGRLNESTIRRWHFLFMIGIALFAVIHIWLNA